MKRGTILGTLGAVGGLVVGISAFLQQQPAQQPQPQTITVDKLKDNLYILRGGGGNTAVFIGTSGVVLVDAKNPGWGQRILDQVRMLTPKPVTHLINTHSHFDHTGGNVEFEPDVEIITHANTPANIEKWALPTGIAQQPDSPFKTNPGKGRPDRTFTDRLTINKGADQVELFYFGRGHTNGDAWVVFPAVRAAHSGDIFANKAMPILDAANGGSGLDIPDTLSKAADTLAKNNVETIITGHAPTTMTVADLREFADFNRDFLNTVREGKKAGRSVDDIAAAYKVPAQFKGYGTPAPARVKANVEVAYGEVR